MAGHCQILCRCAKLHRDADLVDQIARAGANDMRAKDTIGRTLGLVGAVQMNERPTIFYAPLEGEKFVRQMMTPINPDILLLLVRSGWSIDRTFSIGVSEMNGLKNAPTASGPTPSREPEFREFAEAAKLLRALQRDNRL